MAGSGLPSCWWTCAAPYAAFLRNIQIVEGRGNPYRERFGVDFNGQCFPFGGLVYFKQSPSHSRTSRTYSTLIPGIFLGYRISKRSRLRREYNKKDKKVEESVQIMVAIEISIKDKANLDF